MTRYHQLHAFTPAGLDLFRRVVAGELPEDALDPCDPHLATRMVGTGAIDDSPANTAKALAARVLKALGDGWERELGNTGLWAWLSFVLRDQLFPRGKAGGRAWGEVHRWFPSDPSDYRKAERHMIRMPVLLLGRFGDVADHLLCGSPSAPGEVRGQLTAGQDMFTSAFQGAARRLYYDDATGGLRRGAGGKGAGAARRLRAVRRQLDVTWDLFALDADEIIRLLPPEFARFAEPSPAPAGPPAAAPARAG